jgi:hypothetical protein
MRLCLLIAALILCNLHSSVTAAEPYELKKNERIAAVGNSLAERMNLFGNFETLLQTRYPEKQIIFRNFGWPADEVGNVPVTTRRLTIRWKFTGRRRFSVSSASMNPSPAIRNQVWTPSLPSIARISQSKPNASQKQAVSHASC